MIPTVKVRKGREKSLKRRHLWVFSGSLEMAGAELSPWSKLVDCNGNFLAYGAVNPQSKITVKVWSFNENDTPCKDFFRGKILSALNFRKKCGFTFDNAHGVRLINSEGDGLPGVIADDYAGVIVVQFLTCGAAHYREIISEILFENVPGAVAVYEKSDSAILAKEHMQICDGLICGKLPSECIIEENEYLYAMSMEKDWVYQWVVIDPRQPETYRQAERMLTSPKTLGLKLHPSGHGYDFDTYADEMYAFAAEHNAVILIHPSYIDKMSFYADKYPAMKLILAHLGSLEHIDAIKNAKYGNIYTDTSGGLSRLNSIVEYAVEQVGSDKILFGTDTYSMAFQIGRITLSHMAESDKENILYKNALRLFPHVFRE